VHPAYASHALTLQIHYEDFRQFGESFGMQLDDDSLLALYHVHDPEGSGAVTRGVISITIRVVTACRSHRLTEHRGSRARAGAVAGRRAASWIEADETLKACLRHHLS
jgi:hypothetical protein